MRYILISILFISCSKDWTCTITTNGVDSNPVHFHGTTEEAQNYEQDGTQTITIGTQTYIQETNCIPE